MAPLLSLSRVIDAVTAFIGRWIYWLILGAVLVSAGNATIRKIFDISSNAWLELQWYLFGAVFMLAAAYTLQKNEHIRIDIISNMLSQRARDWIDIIGHTLFLLPFTVVMILELYPWVRNSITSSEMSGSAGGLILWPARLCILIGFVLLFCQGISELIKRIAVMRGLIPDPHPHHSAHAPLEMTEQERSGP
jgi:TRAP-type mannitol/chloroaromatic compound transport system permease small subunit